MVLYCLKYLHRHPSEVDLSLEQLGEVAEVAQDLFEIDAPLAGAKLGG